MGYSFLYLYVASCAVLLCLRSTLQQKGNVRSFLHKLCRVSLSTVGSWVFCTLHTCMLSFCSLSRGNNGNSCAFLTCRSFLLSVFFQYPFLLFALLLEYLKLSFWDHPVDLGFAASSSCVLSADLCLYSSWIQIWSACLYADTWHTHLSSWQILDNRKSLVAISLFAG